MNECNHEEAGTTIILLASQETNDVKVVAKDTYALVLLWHMLITISQI